MVDRILFFDAFKPSVIKFNQSEVNTEEPSDAH